MFYCVIIPRVSSTNLIYRRAAKRGEIITQYNTTCHFYFYSNYDQTSGIIWWEKKSITLFCSSTWQYFYRLRNHACVCWLKASAHSFKKNYFAAFKIIFLSLCTYITRMDVMLDFICMGPVDLTGARQKRQNTKWKISCRQWDSNPQLTLRFQGWRSTYWASRAWWMLSLLNGLITFM